MLLRPPKRLLVSLTALALIASGPRRANAQISVIGNNVEEKTAAPGDAYSGTVVVKNLTTREQAARIYQTDYRFFADGTSHFDPPGSTDRSNASWITLSAGSIVIPPSGEITVAYTVRVPAVDTLHGTYWSTIMVEGAVNAPSQTSQKQLSVGTVMRYAIQIASHLNTDASATVILEKERAVTSPSDSSRLIELEIRNNSDRGYRPLTWVEVYDAVGTLRARVQQQRGLLYPGTSVKQTFALGKLSSGPYKAVVFADTGAESVFATQYKLSF